jgi:hypothetical protein
MTASRLIGSPGVGIAAPSRKVTRTRIGVASGASAPSL